MPSRSRAARLITTPLRGADGEIYALAQGNLVIGGAGASQGGSKVQINHLSAGRIPLRCTGRACCTHTHQ